MFSDILRLLLLDFLQHIFHRIFPIYTRLHILVSLSVALWVSCPNLPRQY